VGTAWIRDCVMLRDGEEGLFLNIEGDDGDIRERAAVQGRPFTLAEGLTGDAADVSDSENWSVLDAMEPEAAERGRARAAAVRCGGNCGSFWLLGGLEAMVRLRQEERAPQHMAEVVKSLRKSLRTWGGGRGWPVQCNMTLLRKFRISGSGAA
jgi:hypothetical protein